jgi:predicted nucleic acid-binding Zn ribbon protein
MPSYLYLCVCGDKTEVSHSIHLDPEVKCGDCGQVMQRRPQGAAIQFNAGGFYSVDSKKSDQ